MQHTHKLIIIFVTLVLSCLNVHGYVNKEFSMQRSLFLQVEAELKKGKLKNYHKYKHSLVNYPLYPYLRYELLKADIHNIKHSDISAFIKTYHDSPLANKLRNEWLRAKASKKLWSDFLKAYDVNAKNDTELQCHHINATLQTSQDTSVYELLPKIWLQGIELPQACEPVFDAWRQNGKLTRSLSWQRIKLAITNNELKLARHIAKHLSDQDKKIVELWIRTHHDPYLITKAHYFDVEHAAINEIVINAIIKIAKNKPDEAVKLWKTLEQRHKFNNEQWGVLVKEIALSLARKVDPNAEKWLETVPTHLAGKEVSDARLKLAVRKNDWPTIAKVYLNLAEEESRNEKWQYWYARALEMLGDRSASQEMLINLAQTRNYYGFLASSRVLKPYAFNHEVSDVNQNMINQVLLKPAVIRAYELKHIGRAHTGKTEWVKALESLNDKERLAAAHLAQEWEMPNWAIVALSKAANKNDLVLRFPKNYSEHIHREAKNNDLDPEVIFAITRQESAFIATAKSPVGALGLMQIMPQTGKWLAKINREPLHDHSELLRPEKNIRLGSLYLRMILDQNQQNHALAAASYNAGPHRVARWMPEYDMPVDSWIETIPFKETREYVQNFLTYTVIYQQLLGKTPKMSKYMPIISGLKRTQKNYVAKNIFKATPMIKTKPKMNTKMTSKNKTVNKNKVITKNKTKSNSKREHKKK